MINPKQIVVKMHFGSTLYGTTTSKSDTDYYGIFTPTRRQLLLGSWPDVLSFDSNPGHNKNTSGDIDFKLDSLHKFIQLGCAGETRVIDMIHAPKDKIILTSPIWNLIVENKHKFYSKNITAFVHYQRKQLGKYATKGSRLHAVKSILEFINIGCDQRKFNHITKLKDIWDILPEGEWIKKISKVGDKDGVLTHPNIAYYEVCNRRIGETSSVKYLKEVLEKIYENYGSRAIQAEQNQNIDWKAVSHAFRACYEMKELLTTKNIIFPLKQATFLTKVKLGKFHYKNELVPLLEDLVAEVGEIVERAKLPDKVDTKFWDDLLVFVMEEYVLK